MTSNKMYMVLVARRIRALRILQQITQSELASQSHLSLRTIISMEGGAGGSGINPKVLTLCQLARPLHADPGDLLNMFDPERPIVLAGGPLSADDLYLLYHPIDLMTVRTCSRCGHISPPGEDHLAGGCIKELYEAAVLRAADIVPDLAKQFGLSRSVITAMLDAEYGRHVVVSTASGF